jgi:acyl-CoA synthetase (NDP forming)
VLYLESFGNPRRFGRIARRVARRKPILAMKSGTTRTGARAAGSHTAALAGSETAVEALFHQTGVIRAGTLGELIDAATLLSRQPLPAGPRVAVLTNAGGLGILCADAAEAAGLELPPLSAETEAALRALLPAEASVANPVDMLGSATKRRTSARRSSRPTPESTRSSCSSSGCLSTRRRRPQSAGRRPPTRREADPAAVMSARASPRCVQG